MEVIYIAGSYRGTTTYATERNIQRAGRLAAEVWSYGFAALCPHMNSAHFDGVNRDDVFLEGTLELMRRCDGVLLVPNWKESQGTLAELKEAQRLAIPVFSSIMELNNWSF